MDQNRDPSQGPLLPLKYRVAIGAAALFMVGVAAVAVAAWRAAHDADAAGTAHVQGFGSIVSPPPLPSFTVATTNVQAENQRLTWVAGADSSPYLTDLDDWRRSAHWLEEFANTATTQAYTTAAGAGTGATQSFVPVLDSTTMRPTVVQMQTGTTTTGRWCINSSVTSYTLGTDSQTTYASLMIPVLSTVSDEYTVYLGFIDTISGADQVDGVYFQYDRLTTSSDKWRIATANNSSRSKQTLDGTNGTIDSPITAAGWVNARIKCTSSRCDFYLANPAGTWNNVGSACTAGSGCTLNSVALPSTTSRVFGVGACIVKSAGTTNTLLDLDVLGYYGPFSVPR